MSKPVLVSVKIAFAAPDSDAVREVTIKDVPFSDVGNAGTLQEALESVLAHADKKPEIGEVHSFKMDDHEMIATFIQDRESGG